jgi:pimeloyl-ACP methyl ester carboxylesterase
MASDEKSSMLRVRSPDGSEIASWQTGSGSPLVLVHGTPADHTRWRPLLPPDGVRCCRIWRSHFTVHAVDRRGRGASTDSPDYAIEREFEDIAAVVDAVAATTRSAVSVYGHSRGGCLTRTVANAVAVR